MYASAIHNEAVLIELAKDRAEAKELWRGEPKSAVHCANATPMLMNGIIYGTDCVEGCLIAVDGKTGDRLWKTFEATQPSEERFVKHGTAFLTRLANTNRFDKNIFESCSFSQDGSFMSISSYTTKFTTRWRWSNKCFFHI